MPDNNKLPYSVYVWGSHPDEDNDDCWTGKSFASEAEARTVFEDSHKNFKVDHAYVEIDGPGVYEVKKNPHYVPKANGMDDWRHEIAMQAGMLGGCDAYNEVMGYD